MTTEEKLLIAAETRIRAGGYNGFSFRDIARDAGVTHAGVHHYFPTKEALVARVAEDYTTRFLDSLRAVPPKGREDALRALFRHSIEVDGRMCLCGLLAAESAALPPSVVDAARAFFVGVADLMEETFADAPGVPDPRARALALLAQLEGAALLAQALADPRIFGQASGALHA